MGHACSVGDCPARAGRVARHSLGGITRDVAVPTRPLQRIPPHAVRHDVLTADEHAALLDWTLANEAALQPAMVSGHRVDLMVRNARHFVGEAPWKPVIAERMAALMPGLPAGDYTLRSRTIDEKGIAQPLPRPYLKSGHSAIEAVSIQVTA